MLTIRPLQSFAAIAVAGVLAGCAGGSSVPPAGSSAVPQGVSQTQRTDISTAAKCKSDHGVSVKPCTVTLTTSKPVVTVTTKGPTGGTFTVKDTKCSAKGIATVEGTGNTYTVTAGLTKGKCKAVFTDKDTKGKKIGKATLDITNQV
jgi:hypothetical protein